MFYPQALPVVKMLRFYAQKLPAVEINSTFYRMPRAGTLAEWAGQVPPEFRFVLKAPCKITHAQPLKDKGDALSYFLQTAASLGERLGAVLFQLPPYLHRDIGLFSGFADLLPPGTRAVFEFRHIRCVTRDEAQRKILDFAKPLFLIKNKKGVGFLSESHPFQMVFNALF